MSYKWYKGSLTDAHRIGMQRSFIKEYARMKDEIVELKEKSRLLHKEMGELKKNTKEIIDKLKDRNMRKKWRIEALEYDLEHGKGAYDRRWDY